MKKIISALLLFSLVSCTSTQEKSDETRALERRNLEEYFVGTGVVSYFLPILPKWANNSVEGSCRRARSMRYLDYSKMMSSFNLNYSQLTQFQLHYNSRIWSSMALSNLDFIPFKDAERFFYEVSDKIHAGSLLFKMPRYKRVHLIWIDELLGDSKKIAKLKNKLKGGELTKGYPVFVSLCMARVDLVNFIRRRGLDIGSYEMLTYEMMSPYSSEGEMGLSPFIEVDSFFRGKQVYFYGKSLPSSITAKKNFYFRKLKL